MSWSSPDPVNDRAYFEKGESKFYSLHIKHADGTDINEEEATFINQLLSGKHPQLKWDDVDGIWR